MSYETVLLPKQLSHQGIILAKEQFHNSYTFWAMPILIFGPVYFFLGHPLAMIDRNMDAKNSLKLVLKFWDYEFFGTTTLFYEMLTVGSLFDSKLATFSFKNKFSIFD